MLINLEKETRDERSPKGGEGYTDNVGFYHF